MTRDARPPQPPDAPAEPHPQPAPPAAGEAPRPASGTKRRRILWGVEILAALAVLSLGYWFFFVRGIVRTDDARIAATMVDVSPQISGQIDTMAVDEGDRVAKGQLLFTLDKTMLAAAVAQAKAAVATAEAGVNVAREQFDKALHGPRKGEIEAARAVERRLAVEENLAQSDWEHARDLFPKGAVSKNELDHARARYESARQEHERALQNLRLLEEGTRSEDVKAARASLAMAEARLEQARAGLDAALTNEAHATVTAPFAGVVVRRWLDRGAMTAPSRAVLTLYDPSTVRVDANIEETNLHRISVGDPVDIDVDAYPGVHLRGHVSDILPATNGQFSMVPAEGVSGTFIKVAQRVPLRIALVDPPRKLLLGPGLSVEVAIHAGAGGAEAPADTTPAATSAGESR